MHTWKRPTSTGSPDSVPIVIVDGNFLAYRAFHTCGDLTYNGKSTGTLYGFVLQIQKMRRLFPANSAIVLTWDSRESLRKKMFDGYKAYRKTADPTQEEIDRKQAFYEQVNRLVPEVLEPMGYNINLKLEGYEADDLIASVCMWAGKNRKMWIISSDHDLFQLLDYAEMYQPHTQRNFDREKLKEKWGVCPDEWAQVLAIAGCDTDNVPGVMGVGLKTASDFVAGRKCRPSSVEAIRKARRLIARNMDLVKLPFGGKSLLPANFSVHPYKFRKQGFEQVREVFGFNSLEAY